MIHHEIMMKSLFFVWFLCVATVAFLASFGASRPQTQLKWNWEEVILSRNGPSTTTTPRWDIYYLHIYLRVLRFLHLGGVDTGQYF